MSAATFAFDNTYARDLPDAGVPWKPAPVPAPRLLYLNDALAAELGLDAAALRGDAGAALVGAGKHAAVFVRLKRGAVPGVKGESVEMMQVRMARIVAPIGGDER